jgi:hypothetical protein
LLLVAVRIDGDDRNLMHLAGGAPLAILASSRVHRRRRIARAAAALLG